MYKNKNYCAAACFQFAEASGCELAVKLVQHKDKRVRNTEAWMLSIIAADVSMASQLCSLGYDV